MADPVDPPAPASGSVTIEELPILFDWQCQLRNFMRERLPGDDILFSRWMQNEVPPNPLSKGNADAYLRSPYPPLPNIEIGELQWPTGASRYARALYAVDWSTMQRIAKEAWGYEKPVELIDPDGDPDDPDNQIETEPLDIPEQWGVDHYPLKLVINDGQRTFEASMYALPPYRVTGQGIDLWLVPLVDQRFLFNRRPHTAGDLPEDWEALMESLAGDMGTTITVDAVASAYATPDYRLWKVDNPAAELLDIAALSVGMRVVRDPETGRLRAINATNSNTRRDKTLESEALLLSGGKRGVGARPRGLDLYCDRSDGRFEKRQATMDGGGPGTVRIAAWSSWYLDYEGGTLNNLAATNAFVAKVASDLDDWADSGGQYCFAGTGNYLPSGFDDFCSVQVLETDIPESYRFTSRIYELPSVFLPPAFLVNGHLCEGADHMQYQLITDWFGGLALAVRKDMDGSLLENPYIIVRDPLGIFSYQKAGDKGYMVNECGKYYAWQAPCGNNPAPIPTPDVDPETPTGACCVPKSVPGDNFCQVTTQVDCAAAGGLWLGAGTSCTPGICDGVGE